MLKFNKYLEKIGMKKDNAIFNLPLDENGLHPRMVYSLDTYIGMIIYTLLSYYKEEYEKYYLTNGFPSREDLDIMIKGFKAIAEEEIITSKKQQRRIKRGLRTFINQFNNLWL